MDDLEEHCVLSITPLIEECMELTKVSDAPGITCQDLCFGDIMDRSRVVFHKGNKTVYRDLELKKERASRLERKLPCFVHTIVSNFKA